MEEGKKSYADTIIGILIGVVLIAGLVYYQNTKDKTPTYQETVHKEEYKEPGLIECQSFVKDNLKYVWEEYEKRKLSVYINMTEYPYKSCELDKTTITFQNDNILLTADNTSIRMRILDAKFFKDSYSTIYGVYITNKGVVLFNNFKTGTPELRYSFTLLNNSIIGGGKMELAGLNEAFNKDSVLMKDVLTKINISMDELKQQIEDPSLKGVGGLKGLKPLSEDENSLQWFDERKKAIDNGTLRPNSIEELHKNVRDQNINTDTFKPVGFVGINDSKYDKDIHSLEDLRDINAFRKRH